MGLQAFHVEGLGAFQKLAEQHKEKTIFALFSGTPDASGKNWCPDCVAADPVVDAAVSKAEVEGGIFIHCGVGDRAYWKDQNNAFRKDPVLALKCVPTLICLANKRRLQEGECAKPDLVEMLFSDED